MDRTTTTDRDSVSAAELSTRIPDTQVTGVPKGPTGLWDALAAAATRRHRAEVARVVHEQSSTEVVDVRARLVVGQNPHGILDRMGLDVVPLSG